MSLSSEDALRLNVMIANKPLAIRIHEPSMTLFGLMSDGEVSVKLNPNAPEERYLKSVRAFLSEHALGSPGGYPLYLQRWTRMGQMREQSLEQLLLLGDPTAVFAVVCAEGLSVELARRAWWASEEAENARRMLQTRAVVQSGVGRRLAEYLVEYLPFETEPDVIIESIAAVLQPGLLDPEQVASLWKKAQRKNVYLVGFVAAIPDDLPERGTARDDYADVAARLSGPASTGNPLASLLLRVLDSGGQAFVETCLRILGRPSNQDVVDVTLGVMRGYCAGIRPEGDPDLPIEDLLSEAERYRLDSSDARGCLDAAPELAAEIEALRVLSGLGYGALRPLMKGSTAMGSLMRRKLEPLLEPLSARLEQLLQPARDE